MLDKTPNHICKNPHCHNGDNGGPKHYWACNDCDKHNSWKKVACSEECYIKYMDAITISRGKKSSEVEGQISLFDDDAVVVELGDPIVPDPVIELVRFDDPKKDNATPFMGYHSKKNKHR